MIECLHEKIVVASKGYNCMAARWIDPYRNGLSFTELRAYVKAKKNSFKIKKDDKMYRGTMVDNGEIYDFIAIPELNEICIKHDFYAE